MTTEILILGSSNIDFILRIPRFHLPGETISAENLMIVFGGKGANQAIASRRLGGKVAFATKLGTDHHGVAYRRYLIQHGLDPAWILRDKDHPTGLAVVELIPEGENRIIVSPGANHSFSEDDLRRLAPIPKGIKVFVTQLEVPLRTVRMGLEMAKDHGAITLLNPSPASRLSPDLLSLVDFIVPNELEAQFLTGIKMRGNRDIPRLAKRLLEMGSRNVVITLGSKGLFFKNRSQEISMKAFKVKVVDATAAGDAFMGALAYGLSRNNPLQEVLRLANGAGALAAQKLGAQPSLPGRKDLDLFLRQRDNNVMIKSGRPFPPLDSGQHRGNGRVISESS